MLDRENSIYFIVISGKAAGQQDLEWEFEN